LFKLGELRSGVLPCEFNGAFRCVLLESITDLRRDDDAVAIGLGPTDAGCFPAALVVKDQASEGDGSG
jgi:hypothetical protein